MKMIEHFLSVQGEGIHAGVPAVFVRLATCNQNCKFCDTRYSHSEGTERSIEDLVKELRQYKTANHLVITGGEPLLQATEVLNLLLNVRLDYSFITIETNGSIYPEDSIIPLVDFFSVSPKLKGMSEYTWEPIVEQYLENLVYKMQLKFVVVTNEDYEELRDRLTKLQSYNKFRVPVVLQPNGMADTLNAYAKAYGELALKTANDSFWKTYLVRVLMQNHRVAWKQKSGI